MDLFVIVLRILHIGAGVLWVGSAVAFFFFVQPSAAVLRPDSRQAFFEEVTRRRHFPTFVLATTLVTVLAGAALYWRDSGGFQLDWITSPTGLGFTIGAVAALVSFVIGPIAIKPNIDRLTELGGLLVGENRPPTPDEATTLHTLEQRLKTVGLVDIAFLTIAVLTMATARYWG